MKIKPQKEKKEKKNKTDKTDKTEKIVLVGVLKDDRDLNIIFNKKWYRIPAAYAVKRRFDFLAFYQPAFFGQQGKRIQYYAPVLSQQIVKRKKLLPGQLNHPRAGNYYLRIRIGKVKKLARPIRNIAPRRISFGLTTLTRLLRAKNILELYNIAPTEQLVEQGLNQVNIKATAQHRVSIGRERYCLDFAVFCKQGRIVVECDNKKAHSGPEQRKKDEIKNNALKKAGWTVIRLSEQEIISDLPGSIAKIKKAVRSLGGLA